MAGLPVFSPTDRKRLKTLGVVDAQIEQLRYARLHIRVAVSPPAARNDVAAILDDVATMADKLLQKTASISRQSSAAHATAHGFIEQGYWQTRPDDEGGQSFHCLAPRLKALRDAARAGKCELPSVPSRLRSANPQPIRAINEALHFGWTKEHGSDVFHVHWVDGKETKTYANGPQRKRYPEMLMPSAADSSAFRAVVGICYEAEGGNPDPLAAIKAYLRAEGKIHKEALAALEEGITSVGEAKE